MKIIKATDKHYYIRHWFVWKEYYDPNQVLALQVIHPDHALSPLFRTSEGFLTFRQYKFQALFNTMSYRRLNTIGFILLFLLSPFIATYNWGIRHGFGKHTKTNSW